MTYNVFSGTLNPTHFTSLRLWWCCHGKLRINPVHLMNVDWVADGCQPSNQANRLSCESPIGFCHPHPPLSFTIITVPKSWWLYGSTEGSRLGQCRHCSNGVQLCLKLYITVAVSDKHNCLQWDSDPGPLTLHNTARPLRPVVCQ